VYLLLKRLQSWRAEMRARGAFSSAELAELEDHLLEEAGRLAEAGRSDDGAFLEALRRLGTDDELVEQFRLSRAGMPAPLGAWAGWAVAAALGLCRGLRGLVVFCLPGLALAIPATMVLHRLRDEALRYLASRRLPLDAYPQSTPAAWGLLDLLTRHAWWVVPLLVLVAAAPTLHRIAHRRDRTDDSLGSILADDLAADRPLLLAGVLAYPLLFAVFLRLTMGPVFRIFG